MLRYCSALLMMHYPCLCYTLMQGLPVLPRTLELGCSGGSTQMKLMLISLLPRKHLLASKLLYCE